MHYVENVWYLDKKSAARDKFYGYVLTVLIHENTVLICENSLSLKELYDKLESKCVILDSENEQYSSSESENEEHDNSDHFQNLLNMFFISIMKNVILLYFSV